MLATKPFGWARDEALPIDPFSGLMLHVAKLPKRKR
jgi:hypothetical protein